MDETHPKRLYGVDARLKYKGIDVERMRSGETSTTKAANAGVAELGQTMIAQAFASDVPRGTETCEHVAMLAMRQENERWPVQKTEEWAFARASCLTASDVGAALGIDSHRDAASVLAQKRRTRATEDGLKASRAMEANIGVGASAEASAARMKKPSGERKKFAHPASRHGDAYEDEALAHYEKVNETKCFRFGMKTHDDFFWLGASPDAIHPAGRVVEIKCPFTRPILPNGKRMVEHYAQIQTLLEVFDCEFCDFVQYKPAGRGKGFSGNVDAPAYLCETVPRDREWFAARLPVLESFARALPSPS